MFKELNILKLFFDEPNREFNVREVARLVKVSPATASSELKKYVGLDILKERKERMLKLYGADLEKEMYRDLKLYYLLRKIREIGLISVLNKKYLKPAIVLFGSAALGMDTEIGDIDLLIVSEKISFIDLKKYEKKLKRNIQVINVKSVKDIKNNHLVNNILNGFVLQGKIRWI
tara:strand:- start:849 stop:1370 length:522 start_codon:yes stop_codon:yes gene_type:complete